MQSTNRKWYNGINTNAFRYCGEYYDSETGTIYLRARHYNPSNGRFTQRDSFDGKQGDPLSLNLYTYCHNNPIVGIDPSGNFFMPRKTLETYINLEPLPTPPPNSYVIYSAYGKKETKLNKKQAKVIRKQYEKEYGGTCKVYEVNSAEEFVDTWNSLDDSSGIDAIQVISHGHVSDDKNSNNYGIGYIYFNEGALYSSSFEGLTGGNRSINDVQSKNVGSIYFSACNTGNPDFNSNIMDSFFNKNTSAKSVTGWDGGVTFRFHQRGFRSIFSGDFKWKVNQDVSGANQETFKKWKNPNDDRKEGSVVRTRN